MHNQDVRTEAKKAGVMLWQIADALGMNDGNFSRLLRRELPPEKKTQIFEIINNLSKGVA